jgi:hypothetical protein
MKAELILRERHLLADAAFVEMRIWRVARPVPGSAHDLKYALAYVVHGVCVLHYDNEAGEGDHRHIGEREQPYAFTSPETLLADFWKDVDAWRPE